MHYGLDANVHFQWVPWLVCQALLEFFELFGSWIVRFPTSSSSAFEANRKELIIHFSLLSRLGKLARNLLELWFSSSSLLSVVRNLCRCRWRPPSISGRALPVPWQKDKLLQVSKVTHLVMNTAFIQFSVGLCLMQGWIFWNSLAEKGFIHVSLWLSIIPFLGVYWWSLSLLRMLKPYTFPKSHGKSGINYETRKHLPCGTSHPGSGRGPAQISHVFLMTLVL